MKKYVWISAILVMMSICSYSQSGSRQRSEFPKAVTIDGRELVLITPGQVRFLNATHTDLLECEEKKDSLSGLVKRAVKQFTNQKKDNSRLLSTNKKQERVIKNDALQYKSLQDSYKTLEVNNGSLRTENARQSGEIKVWRWCSIGLAAALTGVLIIN